MGTDSKKGDLVIPAGVNTIKAGAFENCTKLGTVEFKDSAERMAAIEFPVYGNQNSWDANYNHSSVFRNCKTLTKITLSNRVETVPQFFAEGCSALKTVVCKNRTRLIGWYAFANCTALEQIDIPDHTVEGLEQIYSYAFSNCSSLELPNFPAGLKTINERAFYTAALGNGDAMGDLVIPSSVETIAAGAFEGCTKLGTVTFKDGEGEEIAAMSFPVYGNQNSWDANYNHSSVFRNCKALTKITLSNRVKVVPQFFADGCTALQTVVFSSAAVGGTETIGWCAFSGCTSLEAPELPGTLVTIYTDAFKGSALGTESTLGTLNIPGSVTTVESGAFENCSKLGHILFKDATGDKITAMTCPDNMMKGCTSLYKVTFSNRFEKIPTGFAEGCAALKEIGWNAAVKTIGDAAFKGCTALPKFDLTGSGVETIGKNAYAGCTFTEAPVIPATVKSIGEGAFKGIPMGTEDKKGTLTIPNTVTGIGKEAFANCKYLEKIEFAANNSDPNPMVLGANLFAGCESLSVLIFTDRVKDIPAGAAYNCPTLRTINISDGIKSIGNQAFYVKKANWDDPAIKTMLGTTNTVALEYNWSGDNRTLSRSRIFTITYILDGGVNNKENPADFEEDTETFELKDPTKEDWIFAGWYLDKEFTKLITEVEKGTLENLTLYAYWTQEELETPYTITYHPNGGTVPETNPTQYGGTKVIVLPGGTKKGYTFAGWAYADGTRFDRITIGMSGDLDLYATWAPISYTVVFDGNGAEGNTQSMPNCKYDQRYRLAENSLVRDGYAFAGWNTKADGTGSQYGDMADIMNLADESSIVTLYAQWVPGAYSIKYYMRSDLSVGADNNAGNPHYYTAGDSVTLKKPTMRGYIFKGWYTDYRFKKKTTGIKAGTTGDVKFYAKWAEGKYNIKFDKNGKDAKGTMSTLKNRKYEKEYTLTKNKFTRTGYTFVGWNTKKDGTGTFYANKATVKSLADSKKTITLYAQWKLIKYTVTYNCGEGSFAEGKAPADYVTTFTVKSGTISLKNLTPPVRDGYTFQYWCSDKKCKKKITSFKASTAKNKTVYAKWKKAPEPAPAPAPDPGSAADSGSGSGSGTGTGSGSGSASKPSIGGGGLQGVSPKE